MVCNHCADCHFNGYCKSRAIKRDDVALLGGLKPKDVLGLRQRGITTITQLAYTFRLEKKSRRLKNVQPKYKPSLKAMAIRDNKIYIADAPSIEFLGTQIFLDVEGMPDQEFYYLIGMQVVGPQSTTQHSFWANSCDEERMIWRECVRVLVEEKDAQIIHYGSYETTFFRRMKTRYGEMGAPEGLIDKLLARAINLISIIRGYIYFPSYSNGLKEIASHLGFQWVTNISTGRQSIQVRRNWERLGDDHLKRELIAYNQDDCRALELVVNNLRRILSNAPVTTADKLNAVPVDTVKPEWLNKWGKTEFVSPELAAVNECAYWDYQRNRIYVRSNARLRRSLLRQKRIEKKQLQINDIVASPRPTCCPQCSSIHVKLNGRHRKTVYDIKFTPGGIKRWNTENVTTYYICRACGSTFSPNEKRGRRQIYGCGLRSYVIYNLIQLGISHTNLQK